MKISKTYTPTDRADWRAWLAEHHTSEQEVWVVFFKPASGKTGITYEESIEEALCFGWVDSIIQKLDEEKYARKFNPRRAGSYWSASNKKRMEKLILEGKITPGGQATYDPNAPESASPEGLKIRRGETPIPDEVKSQIMATPQAWEAFQKLPPSHQRQYLGWVLSAKKAETQQKRLREVIEVLAQGKKLGLK